MFRTALEHYCSLGKMSWANRIAHSSVLKWQICLHETSGSLWQTIVGECLCAQGVLSVFLPLPFLEDPLLTCIRPGFYPWWGWRNRHGVMTVPALRPSPVVTREGCGLYFFLHQADYEMTAEQSAVLSLLMCVGLANKAWCGLWHQPAWRGSWAHQVP